MKCRRSASLDVPVSPLSHRLYSEELSSSENQRLFGKCTNPNGHGHNYILEVTLEGKIDPNSLGCFIVWPIFKAIIDQEVMSRLDHKNLNLDVPEFKRLVPTAENIAFCDLGIFGEEAPKRFVV